MNINPGTLLASSDFLFDKGLKASLFSFSLQLTCHSSSVGGMLLYNFRQVNQTLLSFNGTLQKTINQYPIHPYYKYKNNNKTVAWIIGKSQAIQKTNY